MNDEIKPEPPPSLWAICELFGHQRIAGRVSEQTFGGAQLVRVDVPQVKLASRMGDAERVIQAHTRSFGPSAIYSINWTDEETATVAAHGIRHEPISAYSVRAALEGMPGGSQSALGFDRDDD